MSCCKRNFPSFSFTDDKRHICVGFCIFSYQVYLLKTYKRLRLWSLCRCSTAHLFTGNNCKFFLVDLKVRVVITCHVEGQTEHSDLIHDGWRQDSISFVLASIYILMVAYFCRLQVKFKVVVLKKPCICVTTISDVPYSNNLKLYTTFLMYSS